MLKLNIPGKGEFSFEYLVLDYNGTLALDGVPYDCVYNLLKELSKKLKIYVLTADTFGNVSKYADKLSAEVKILATNPISQAKDDIVKELGVNKTIAIGNGKNDEKMLKSSALGIALIQIEGLAKDTLLTSDIIYTSICDALQALINSKRLVASLRI